MWWTGLLLEGQKVDGTGQPRPISRAWRRPTDAARDREVLAKDGGRETRWMAATVWSGDRHVRWQRATASCWGSYVLTDLLKSSLWEVGLTNWFAGRSLIATEDG